MAYFKMNLTKFSVAVLLIWCLECISVTRGNNMDNPVLLKCCPENGYIHNESTCLVNDLRVDISLKCSSGSYIVDPTADVVDQFAIADGELYLNYSESKVEPDGFCIGLTPFDNGTLHEVAILCFQEREHEPEFFIKGIMALISVGFICATLYVYKIIPQLRDTQDKVTIICISCLALAFTVLGIVQTLPVSLLNDGMCITLGILIYAFMMGYLAWLNTVVANVFKVVVLPHWKIKESKWYISNHIYGWSVSILLTVILVTCQHIELDLHPGIGSESCWLDVKMAWLYMYIPFTIMITMNLIMFIIIIVTLYKSPNNNLTSSRKKALKIKCRLYLKLFILAGITWFFEVFSYIFREWKNYWHITDAVNALHGILIFLVLVIFRKRVRRELAGKKICFCCRVPQEWRKIDDDEDCEFTEDTKYDNINIRSQNDHHDDES